MTQPSHRGRGILAVAAAVTVAACSSTSPSTSRQNVPTTATTAAATAETAGPGSGTIDSISGSFEIVNTTEDGSAVGIEQIFILVERQVGEEWQTVSAECATDPNPPLVVESEQVFIFECELVDIQPAGTDLQAIAQAEIFGLDEPYRQVIELP